MAGSNLKQLSISRLVTLACLAEVSASKPGNVHRGADFADTTFHDFQNSAVILGQAIEDKAATGRLGETILHAVKLNQQFVGLNTNLGMILLLCPLAQAAMSSTGGDLKVSDLAKVLRALTEDDSKDVFEAIRLAKPGGLGSTSKHDVSNEAPASLLEAMDLAKDRDLIARQYVTDFEIVFGRVVDALLEGHERFGSLNEAIVFAHVKQMAEVADSLIERKCGAEVAEHSRFLAERALQAADFWEGVSELDFWCRSDGNRRNPGTTADLICAGLFVCFANGRMVLVNSGKNAH